MDPVPTISKIFMLREHWIPDHKAQRCFCCQTEFGVLNRRHHCRMCGNVFDRKCADTFVTPPLFIYEDEKRIRLCLSCFAIINRDLRKERITNCKATALNFHLNPGYAIELEKSINKILGAKWTELSHKVLAFMLKESRLYDQWFSALSEIMIESIETVQPNTLLNDDINIIQYIKVKTVPYADNSLTKLVRGVVLRRNYTHKKMNNVYYDAKVLMIKGNIEKFQGDASVLESEAINAENQYLESIVKKILELDPSVVIVEGNVSRTVHDALFNAGKAIVTRLRKSQFEKIKRCTQARPIQDLEKLQNADSNVLGTCMNLYVVNHQNKELYEEVKKFRPDDIYTTFDPSLMFIESYYPEKEATIVLSGPKYQELQLIKRCLQEAFRILRNIFLEQSLISQEISLFHTRERLWELMANESNTINVKEISNIRETLTVENYQASHIEEISLTSCLLNQSAVASVGFMMYYLTERAPIEKIIKESTLNFTKLVFVPIKLICFPDLMHVNAQQIERIEEDIKQTNCWYRDEFCQLEKFPQPFRVYFYNKEDISLGAYLWNKYVCVLQTCSHCNMDFYSHTTILLLKKFYIKITLEVKDSSKLQKIKKKNKKAQNKPNPDIDNSSTPTHFLDVPPVPMDKSEFSLEPQPQNHRLSLTGSLLISSTNANSTKAALTKTFANPVNSTAPATKKTEIMMFIECSTCGNQLSDKVKLSQAYLEYSFTRYLEGLTGSAEEYLDYLIKEQLKNSNSSKHHSEHSDTSNKPLGNIPRRPNVRPCCPLSSKNRVFIVKDLFIRFRIGSSNPYTLSLINFFSAKALATKKNGEKDLTEAKKAQLYQLQRNYLNLILSGFKQVFYHLLEDSSLCCLKGDILELTSTLLEEAGLQQKDPYHFLITELVSQYKEILHMTKEVDAGFNEPIEHYLKVNVLQKEFYQKLVAIAVNMEKTRESYLKMIHENNRRHHHHHKEKRKQGTVSFIDSDKNTTKSMAPGDETPSVKGSVIYEEGNSLSRMKTQNYDEPRQSFRAREQEFDKEINYVDSLIAALSVESPEHPGQPFVKFVRLMGLYYLFTLSDRKACLSMKTSLFQL